MKTLLLILSFFIVSSQVKCQNQKFEKILRGHDYTVLSIDRDSQGKFLVSGSYDTNLIIWDYMSGKILQKITNHNAGVWCVNISPDNKYIASGSWNNNTNANGSSEKCINIIELSTLKVINSLSIDLDRYKDFTLYPEFDRYVPNGIYNIFFNKSGEKLAALTKSGDLYVWDMFENYKKTVYEYGKTEHKILAISPDWKYIACSKRKRALIDSSFYLIGFGTNDIVTNFSIPQRSVIEIQFSHNSNYIACVSGDRIKRNEIDIWNTKNQKLVHTLIGHSNVVRSLVFSKDDRYLASVGEDNIINLWNVETGKLITSFTENNYKELTSVVFSFDEKYLISGSQDKTIKYWNIENFIVN